MASKNCNNKNVKGQAAIEFLITYGWAIMAAMIVIGALVYFGMTNPATSLPDKCVFSNGFDCKDYQIVAPATLWLKVVNIQGQTLYNGTMRNISAYVTDSNPIINCSITGGGPTFLDPESEMEIRCNNIPGNPYNSKEKAKVKVTIVYAKNPNGYSQVALGEIYATVQ